MNHLHVLHVDDEPDIREVTALSLELDGAMTLTSAASGADALGLLERGSRPDVILLDVMMPVLDGPGALARLRLLPGHFMTARAQATEVHRYVELGAIGVIVKPFDPMSLAACVRDILAEVSG